MAMIIMKKDDRMGKAGVLQVNCSYNALIVRSPPSYVGIAHSKRKHKILMDKTIPHTPQNDLSSIQPMQNCFDQNLVEIFFLLLK